MLTWSASTSIASAPAPSTGPSARRNAPRERRKRLTTMTSTVARSARARAVAMTVRTVSRSSLLPTAIVLRHPGQFMGFGTSSRSTVATTAVEHERVRPDDEPEIAASGQPAPGECEQQVDEGAEDEAAERSADVKTQSLFDSLSAPKNQR